MTLFRPTVRTVLSDAEFIAVLMRAWPEATKRSAALILAQHRCETGAKDCYGYNFANVRPLRAEPYHCLRGVWEGVTAAEAAKLVASGRAKYDTNVGHQKAVAPKTAVVFNEGELESRFRAYDTAEEGMSALLTKLRGRFAKSWPFVVAGDVPGFASALKSQGYFTASAAAYTALMNVFFIPAMKSPDPLIPVDPNENTIASVAHGSHVVDWALAMRDENAFGIEVGEYGFMKEEAA
jgi:hypothetical protein